MHFSRRDPLGARTGGCEQGFTRVKSMEIGENVNLVLTHLILKTRVLIRDLNYLNRQNRYQNTGTLLNLPFMDVNVFQDAASRCDNETSMGWYVISYFDFKSLNNHKYTPGLIMCSGRAVGVFCVG